MTEALRKQSLASNHADSSFEFYVADDGASTTYWTKDSGTSSVSSTSDSDRRSNVLYFGTGSSTWHKAVTWNRTEDAVSLWYNVPTQTGIANFNFNIDTSAGTRTIKYHVGDGADSYASSVYNVYIGENEGAGWTRFQSNIAADIARLTGGVTLTDVNYMGVVCRELYIDDVRFSNSLTTQTEVVGPGAIGQILRDSTFDATRPWMETGTWFHYDQVGSVMCSTDGAGALVSQIQQDTFGNTQSGWATGQWGGTKAGWHHNSKEYDGDVDLVLMGMRWYLPETGTFVSKAPMPMWREHPYSFAQQNPAVGIDPAGQDVITVGIGGAGTLPGGGVGGTSGFVFNPDTTECGLYTDLHGGLGSGASFEGPFVIGYYQDVDSIDDFGGPYSFGGGSIGIGPIGIDIQYFPGAGGKGGSGGSFGIEFTIGPSFGEGSYPVGVGDTHTLSIGTPRVTRRDPGDRTGQGWDPSFRGNGFRDGSGQWVRPD